MTEDYIRQLQIERAELIELLSQARSRIAACTGLLEYFEADAKANRTTFWGETAARTLADTRAFLDAGLFGDKVQETAS